MKAGSWRTMAVLQDPCAFPKVRGSASAVSVALGAVAERLERLHVVAPDGLEHGVEADVAADPVHQRIEVHALEVVGEGARGFGGVGGRPVVVRSVVTVGPGGAAAEPDHAAVGVLDA